MCVSKFMTGPKKKFSAQSILPPLIRIVLDLDGKDTIVDPLRYRYCMRGKSLHNNWLTIVPEVAIFNIVQHTESRQFPTIC